MGRPKRFRQRTSLVMLVMALLIALAPGISRALAFAQGESVAWAEVCSAASDRRSDPGGMAADPLGHLLDHCPFCLPHAGAMGLPPAAATLGDGPALAHAVPLLFLRAPRPMFAWRSAQPRGPPRAA